ncbi:conserved hypothetical protein [Formosa agariphila KMM 3901]|uniref:Uncharacterized protein n=2 Tax=Formosa TaxID=225842 RepID=T2KP37_FORAG|nr:conserved hypothetical protein [Formosa agariphila KMM 3901]
MTDLEVAERLALVQNKLLVVAWEGSYFDGIPMYINNDKGEEVFVKNLFDVPVVDSLLWAHFIPVILKESEHSRLYENIKNKRSTAYLEKFHDDSVKVMDANGNILNVNDEGYLFNVSRFIDKYSMNMTMLNEKLTNYKRKKDFYSAFFLSASYMDFAFYSRGSVRPELVDLASIYLDEASEFLDQENFENKEVLMQRVNLMEIQKDLLLERPKKVLRKLNRIKEDQVEPVNSSLRSFLYFSSYKMLQDHESAAEWQSKVTSIDIKKVMQLINSLQE